MACESKLWAPSSWSPEKIRRYLRDVVVHIYRIPTADIPEKIAQTEAMMAANVALSKVVISQRYGIERMYELFTDTKPKEETDGTR